MDLKFPLTNAHINLILIQINMDILFTIIVRVITAKNVKFTYNSKMICLYFMDSNSNMYSDYILLHLPLLLLLATLKINKHRIYLIISQMKMNMTKIHNFMTNSFKKINLIDHLSHILFYLVFF